MQLYLFYFDAVFEGYNL